MVNITNAAPLVKRRSLNHTRCCWRCKSVVAVIVVVVVDTLVDATVCTSLWLLMSVVSVFVVASADVGVVESF